ncbi:unnamed protein product, partial [Iphiclides podalirius]
MVTIQLGGQLGRAKQYDDYYRTDGLYVPDGIKAVDSGVQALSLGDHKSDKERVSELKDVSSGSQPKKMTWASIASQPAKPAPTSQTGGLKKKGPGMPPPPIIPGKHNMDISTWDAGKTAPVVSAPPPPPLQPPPVPAPLPMPTPTPAPSTAPLQRGPPPQHQPPPAWAHAPRAPMPHQPRPPLPTPPLAAAPVTATQAATPHPVLDELRVKNNYNPKEFDLSAPLARFFVIKSYSEDDIHRSIKYEIWCSTEHGNKRLDAAFREREREGGAIYLFFSVNGSGHFCGMARMTSAVDYNSNSNVWSQDKWKGQFRVRWIYVKDVPNVQLRHIKLENNENKPVTNSRDTQEVPHAKGLQVLRIMHSYCHSTSIFDDFIHYERRQEEEDSRKVPGATDERGVTGVIRVMGEIRAMGVTTIATAAIRGTIATFAIPETIANPAIRETREITAMTVTAGTYAIMGTVIVTPITGPTIRIETDRVVVDALVTDCM